MLIENLEWYNNATEYSEDVRMFLYMFDRLTEEKGIEIKEQYTCKKPNKYLQTYKNIILIFDNYCEHFVTTPLYNKNKILLTVFIKLYPDYTENTQLIIQEIHKKLDEILQENNYILVDTIHQEDNSYPDELISPLNIEYFHKLINEHYNQEIYKNINGKLSQEDIQFL